MAAVFKLFQRKDPQQELYEPSPRYAHYAAEVNGQLYLYSGRTVRYTAEKEKLQSLVEVVDPLTERWAQKTTEGDIPPGMFSGACTSTGQDLFTFGAFDGKLWYGDLYRLKATQNRLRWTRLTSVARKNGCGIVCLTQNTSYSLLATAHLQQTSNPEQYLPEIPGTLMVVVGPMSCTSLTLILVCIV